MAKSMARIENGLITNLLWCSDSEPETESLIDPADRPVGIGDTYSGGKFCGKIGSLHCVERNAVQSEIPSFCTERKGRA